MAVARRKPERRPVHHSDQGSQYVSLVFGQRCRQAGIRISMGARALGARQRGLRGLLRLAQARARTPALLADQTRGTVGDLRVDRGLVQPAPPALHAAVKAGRKVDHLRRSKSGPPVGFEKRLRAKRGAERRAERIAACALGAPCRRQGHGWHTSMRSPSRVRSQPVGRQPSGSTSIRPRSRRRQLWATSSEQPTGLARRAAVRSRIGSVARRTRASSGLKGAPRRAAGPLDSRIDRLGVGHPSSGVLAGGGEPRSLSLRR